MAKAITSIEKEIPNQVQEEAQALQEILHAAARNKAAILSLLEVISDLYDAGILDIANGFLKNRHKIGVIGVNQLNKSGAQRIIKNGMGALEFLAAVEPAKLKTLLGAVSSGINHAVGNEPEKHQSIWGMFKQIRDPEMLGVMVNFLKGMSEGLQTQTHN